MRELMIARLLEILKGCQEYCEGLETPNVGDITNRRN